MEEECVFCKIIKGEIPAIKIYEDELSMAFLDINPRSKGHTLVIPKKHAVLFTELDDVIAMHLAVVIKHIANEITKKLNAQGFNIMNNNGESAGQVVKHVHFHILPRYGDKGHGMEAAFPVDEDAKKELEATAKAIGIIHKISIPTDKQGEKEEPKPEKKDERKEDRDVGYEGSIFDEVDTIKDY